MRVLLFYSLLILCSIEIAQAQQMLYKDTVINGKKLNMQKTNLSFYRAIRRKSFPHNIKDSLVVKKKGILNLKLQNGKELIFKDITKNEVEGKTFLFKGILNNRFYIVLGKYYDTGEYFLVDKINGKKTSIWGEPIISPDGKHITSFSGALGYDMMPNGVQMFIFKNNQLVSEWEYKIDDWEPKEIIWIDNTSILISKFTPAELSKSGMKINEYIKLKF